MIKPCFYLTHFGSASTLLKFGPAYFNSPDLPFDSCPGLGGSVSYRFVFNTFVVHFNPPEQKNMLLETL